MVHWLIVGDILGDQVAMDYQCSHCLLDPVIGGSTSLINVRNYLPVDIVFYLEDLNLYEHCCENLK